MNRIYTIFDHVVDTTEGESFRQLNHRSANIFEAECLSACSTTEVSMLFVHLTVALSFAYCIFDAATAVYDGMDEFM